MAVFGQKAVGFAKKAVGFAKKAAGYDRKAAGYDRKAAGYDRKAAGYKCFHGLGRLSQAVGTVFWRRQTGCIEALFRPGAGSSAASSAGSEQQLGLQLAGRQSVMH